MIRCSANTLLLGAVSLAASAFAHDRRVFILFIKLKNRDSPHRCLLWFGPWSPPLLLLDRILDMPDSSVLVMRLMFNCPKWFGDIKAPGSRNAVHRTWQLRTVRHSVRLAEMSIFYFIHPESFGYEHMKCWIQTCLNKHCWTGQYCHANHCLAPKVSRFLRTFLGRWNLRCFIPGIIRSRLPRAFPSCRGAGEWPHVTLMARKYGAEMSWAAARVVGQRLSFCRIMQPYDVANKILESPTGYWF